MDDLKKENLWCFCCDFIISYCICFHVYVDFSVFQMLVWLFSFKQKHKYFTLQPDFFSSFLPYLFLSFFPSFFLSFFLSLFLSFFHSFFPKAIESPPFEIKETGWGEFEMMMKIFFTDPIEKSIEVFHNLKLFPREVGLCERVYLCVIFVVDVVVCERRIWESVNLNIFHSRIQLKRGLLWAQYACVCLF